MGLVETEQVEDTLAELILNLDQTRIKMISTWTIDQQEKRCVKAAVAKDKHRITAVFFSSVIQVIYHGQTECCHPTATSQMIGTKHASNH